MPLMTANTRGVIFEMLPNLKELLRIRIMVLLLGAPAAWSLFIVAMDPRATRYVWPLLLVSSISAIAASVFHRKPSALCALLAQIPIALQVPAFLYGVLFWPIIAIGGPPRGQGLWAAGSFIGILLNIFLIWPIHLRSRNQSKH